MSVELKVELKMGPVTISYEAPEGADLFWCSDAEFIQKIMDLMNFIGTAEDPPADPHPVPSPRYPGIGPYSGVVLTGTGNLTTSHEIPGQASLLDDDDDDDDDDDGEMDLDDFFETDEVAGPQGTVVGRVSGVREVRAS